MGGMIEGLVMLVTKGAGFDIGTNVVAFSKICCAWDQP
jgi:hypothetical protein